MGPSPRDVELIRRRGRSSPVIGLAGMGAMAALAASGGRAVWLIAMVGYHPMEGRGVRLSLGLLQCAANGLDLFLAGLGKVRSRRYDSSGGRMAYIPCSPDISPAIPELGLDPIP